MSTNGICDEPPPIEQQPPYSVDFVAHLHGGCYPELVTADLLVTVRQDPSGARLLDALTITQLELRIIGQSEQS